MAKKILIAIIGLICLRIYFDLGEFEGPIVELTSYAVFTSLVVGFAAIVYFQNLVSYVGKRLGGTVFVLFVIATTTFLMLRFLPGGPFDTDKALPPEVMANIEAKYNLDKPLLEQYGIYMGRLIQGDFGESYKYVGRGVTDIIVESLPNSLQLGFYSLLLSFLVGIPLGVLAASKHNTIWDTSAMFVAISGVALPSFLVGPILVLIFSYYMNWFPPALWEGPSYYVLPVLTLGLRPAAIIARLTRSSVLDTIGEDFIRTAMAKGLAYKIVLFKHVLRNSLIPVVTMSGPLVANILSGSFIIEMIFAVPGLGKHFVQSVTNRDYPLVLGVTLLYAALLVVANLLVDLLYVVIDPRIQVQS
ncbi:MAG: ABC transporter permease [Bdellovibrionales bacterium]